MHRSYIIITQAHPHQPFKICNLSDYSVLSTGPLLSHSPLASVYVSNTVSNQYVVKQVTTRNAEKIKSLLHEASILTHLSNFSGYQAVVVEFHGIDMGVDRNILPALVFEKMDCSLNDWAKQNLSQSSTSRRTSQLKAVLGSVSLQLIGALSWLHEQGAVVHGDIKPANILVRCASDKGSSKKFSLCFADFASACMVHEPKLAHTGLTFAYMAPEKFRNAHDPPTTGGDVWALAVTLLEIVAGRVPYSDMTPRVRKLAAIGNGEPAANVEDEVRKVDCADFVVRVLGPALRKEPHDRIDAVDWSALAYAFFYARED
jgi:serine/threonine protein kinase